MTFSQKKDHWADKKFLFFFDTPGTRAAYNGGTVHLHISGHDRKKPAKLFNFYLFEPHDTARARLWAHYQNVARTDGHFV